jgi:hypothetical protein
MSVFTVHCETIMCVSVEAENWQQAAEKAEEGDLLYVEDIGQTPGTAISVFSEDHDQQYAYWAKDDSWVVGEYDGAA